MPAEIQALMSGKKVLLLLKLMDTLSIESHGDTIIKDGLTNGFRITGFIDDGELFDASVRPATLFKAEILRRAPWRTPAAIASCS